MGIYNYILYNVQNIVRREKHENKRNTKSNRPVMCPFSANL